MALTAARSTAHVSGGKRCGRRGVPLRRTSERTGNACPARRAWPRHRPLPSHTRIHGGGTNSSASTRQPPGRRRAGSPACPARPRSVCAARGKPLGYARGVAAVHSSAGVAMIRRTRIGRCPCPDARRRAHGMQGAASLHGSSAWQIPPRIARTLRRKRSHLTSHGRRIAQHPQYIAFGVPDGTGNARDGAYTGPITVQRP